MRTIVIAGLVAGLLAIGTASLRADEFLKNGDLKEGMAGWHGDGSLAFLNPDNTEGAETDSGVTPAIKLTLSRGNTRTVYQEFSIRNGATEVDYKVDVLVTKDVVRSSNRNDFTSELYDYTKGSFHWNAVGTCNVDFWVRSGPDPDWFYLLAKSMVGQWETLEKKTSTTPSSDSKTVLFCVPPGEGAVFFKNASVTEVGK